jgi:16S rRNA (guanine(1405)-N(7))-methyltransferase
MIPSSDLDRLTGEILSRKKYRSLDEDFIRRIGAQELERQRSYKDAVHATRNRLHQVSCSYQEKPINLITWQEKLKLITNSLDSEDTRTFCKSMMHEHTSTNERLPILERFFRNTLAELPEIHTILDCACGLNPLSLPWIPCDKEVSYQACDVSTDLAFFLGKFFEHFNIDGKAWTCDLTTEIPAGHFDLALILKTTTCLEQQDKNAAARLLEGMDAKYILLSYPIASLGGHDKGMIRNYSDHFERLSANWTGGIKRFEFETELAFLLSRLPN